MKNCNIFGVLVILAIFASLSFAQVLAGASNNANTEAAEAFNSNPGDPIRIAGIVGADTDIIAAIVDDVSDTSCSSTKASLQPEPDFLSSITTSIFDFFSSIFNAITGQAPPTNKLLAAPQTAADGSSCINDCDPGYYCNLNCECAEIATPVWPCFRSISLSPPGGISCYDNCDNYGAGECDATTCTCINTSCYNGGGTVNGVFMCEADDCPHFYGSNYHCDYSTCNCEEVKEEYTCSGEPGVSNNYCKASSCPEGQECVSNKGMCTCTKELTDCTGGEGENSHCTKFSCADENSICQSFKGKNNACKCAKKVKLSCNHTSYSGAIINSEYLDKTLDVAPGSAFRDYLDEINSGTVTFNSDFAYCTDNCDEGFYCNPDCECVSNKPALLCPYSIEVGKSGKIKVTGSSKDEKVGLYCNYVNGNKVDSDPNEGYPPEFEPIITCTEAGTIVCTIIHSSPGSPSECFINCVGASAMQPAKPLIPAVPPTITTIVTLSPDGGGGTIEVSLVSPEGVVPPGKVTASIGGATATRLLTDGVSAVAPFEYTCIPGSYATYTVEYTATGGTISTSTGGSLICPGQLTKPQPAPGD